MAHLSLSPLELEEQKKISDFTITCGTKKFKVHKDIICADSPFFHAICTHSFKERLESRLDLPVDHEGIVARVLLFMYTGDYDDSKVLISGFEMTQISGPLTTATTDGHETGSFHTEFAAPLTFRDDMTSNLRNVTNLRTLAKKMRPVSPQQQKMVADLETNAQVYLCADRLMLEKLRKHAASKFMKRLWSVFDAKDTYPAIRFAYENTIEDDHNLRDEATRFCIQRHRRVRAFPKFVALLNQHEPSAWKLAVEIKRKQQDELGRHRAEQQILEKENAELKRKLSQAQEEVKNVVQLVNGERFMSGSRCMKADMKLDSHTNHVGTKQYQLTCKCCDKKHEGAYIVLQRR